MIILVGSKIDQANIQDSLGKPEYSYFFLMRDFVPVLERLGHVHIVESTGQIEALCECYRAAGEEVVFFSFSPPHQVPLGLSCPTVVVFAWEFDSLPSIVWDDNPQNDWRYTFANLQGVVCTSREAARLVESNMPADFPVIALPAPVWDRYGAGRTPQRLPLHLGGRQFPFAGVVIDSPTLGLSADGLVRKPSETVQSGPRAQPAASGRFAETWQLSKALLRGWWREVRLPLAPAIDSEPPAAAQEPATEQAASALPAQSIAVSGVVYTTVLNPADSRKNWIDVVTAFCWAFKHSDDATLIVKMTHHDLEFYRIVLITLLSRLAPFRCRVIVLHGFLEDAQYRELIEVSTYYVNASSGEGLCLPLMEFLSSGKPAIAPVHTAMADYVTADMAFLLKTALEPFCWPHDPTGVFATHRHRLNWQSLLEAFKASYRIARGDPERYLEMSRHAAQGMQAFASIDVVAKPLAGFVGDLMQRNEAPRSQWPNLIQQDASVMS
jgi:hypothetical protein